MRYWFSTQRGTGSQHSEVLVLNTARYWFSIQRGTGSQHSEVLVLNRFSGLLDLLEDLGETWVRGQSSLNAKTKEEK